MFSKIEGLNPPAGTVSTSSYAGMDGSYLNNALDVYKRQGNYIWNPSVQAGVLDTILNRPYKTSSYVPEIKAGNKCMAFGDFSYYWVADRQGRSFKRLNELFAMTGQVGFLASQRLDGLSLIHIL